MIASCLSLVLTGCCSFSAQPTLAAVPPSTPGAKMVYAFELTAEEVNEINSIIQTIKLGETSESIKNFFMKIRQLDSLGAQEEISADKRNEKKILAHCVRIYIKRIDKNVHCNDITVDFWFKDKVLKSIASNCDSIKIPAVFIK